jgi:hypothetical protein
LTSQKSGNVSSEEAGAPTEKPPFPGRFERPYREETHTYMWLTTTVEDIALKIVARREEALGDRVGRPP